MRASEERAREGSKSVREQDASLSLFHSHTLTLRSLLLLVSDARSEGKRKTGRERREGRVVIVIVLVHVV